MAKQKDVFGFDEFEKALEQVMDKYEDKSEALLYATAKQAGKRMRQIAPVGKNPKPDRKGKPLKQSYRVKKPKDYKPDGEIVKVALVANNAYHSHLVEYGHEIYTTGGRKLGKLKRYNRAGRKAMGVKHHGRVEGKYLFDKVWKEYESRFPKEAQKILDEITKDLEV